MNETGMKNKVASGLFWKLLENGGAQGIQFVIAILLARLLTPAEYGVVGIIMIFITIANVFVQSGFSTALVQKKQADEVDFSSVCYFELAASVLFYLLLYPIAKFTSLLSFGILKIGGVRIDRSGDDGTMSKVDLDFFIQQSIDKSQGEAEVDTEVKIFQNALDFSNLRIRECMIPRTEIVAVDIDMSSEKDLVALFIETGLSKILVYRDNIDNVLGYIHSSEMFKQAADWKSYIKPILLVPETMTAQKLMKNLMQQKKSIAVVVDEFGGTAGIVTLEDLVEEIFGDIEDEHDTLNYIARRTGENCYEFSGRVEIEKINELFDIGLPESDEYMTIAGYILYHYKTIPKPGETIEIENYKFEILKGNRTKIELVKMKIEN